MIEQGERGRAEHSHSPMEGLSSGSGWSLWVGRSLVVSVVHSNPEASPRSTWVVVSKVLLNLPSMPVLILLDVLPQVSGLCCSNLALGS